MDHVVCAFQTKNSGRPWCCHVDLSCCSIFNLLCKVNMTTGKLSESFDWKSNSFHTINLPMHQYHTIYKAGSTFAAYTHIFGCLSQSISINLPYLTQLSCNLWVFPKIGVPQNGWFIMENPIKIHDLGGVYHPYFWKHPYANTSL